MAIDSPQYICSGFTRLDPVIYISTVIEEEDDLSSYQAMELQCFSGDVLICESRWSVEQPQQVYTMWFDIARMTHLGEFSGIPLTAKILLDGYQILTKDVSLVVDLNYARKHQRRGV